MSCLVNRLIEWRDGLANHPDFKVGTVVYLQWEEGVSKRVVIGLGHMQRRNFLALYKVSPKVGFNLKDTEVICCAPGAVVHVCCFFLILTIVVVRL